MTAFSEKPTTPKPEGAVPPTFSGPTPKAGDFSPEEGGQIKTTIYAKDALRGATGEEALSVEAREQWCRFIKHKRHYRRIIRNIVGPGYCDDVYQDLTEAIYRHLLRNGAVDDIDPYAGRAAVNAAKKHHKKVRKMLEMYVGEDTDFLESANSPSLIENYGLRRILTVFQEKKILTLHELRVFALREGFDKDTRTVAKIIGPPTTGPSVRTTMSKAMRKIEAARDAGRLDELREYLPQDPRQTKG